MGTLHALPTLPYIPLRGHRGKESSVFVAASRGTSRVISGVYGSLVGGLLGRWYGGYEFSTLTQVSWRPWFQLESTPAICSLPEFSTGIL